MAQGGGGNKPKPPTTAAERRPSGGAAKHPWNVVLSNSQELVRVHQHEQSVSLPRKNRKQGSRKLSGIRAKRRSRIVRALQGVQGFAKGAYPWVALLAYALTIWHYWPSRSSEQTEATHGKVSVCSQERPATPAISSGLPAPCDLNNSKIEVVLPIKIDKVGLPSYPTRVTRRHRRH
jgi:hypothetical protein